MYVTLTKAMPKKSQREPSLFLVISPHFILCNAEKGVSDQKVAGTRQYGAMSRRKSHAGLLTSR